MQLEKYTRLNFCKLPITVGGSLAFSAKTATAKTAFLLLCVMPQKI